MGLTGGSSAKVREGSTSSKLSGQRVAPRRGRMAPRLAYAPAAERESARAASRLDHGGLQPRPLARFRLADDVHLPLRLVPDLVHLDARELLRQHLGQLVELGLVLGGNGPQQGG